MILLDRHHLLFLISVGVKLVLEDLSEIAMGKLAQESLFERHMPWI